MKGKTPETVNIRTENQDCGLYSSLEIGMYSSQVPRADWSWNVWGARLSVRKVLWFYCASTLTSSRRERLGGQRNLKPKDFVHEIQTMLLLLISPLEG